MPASLHLLTNNRVKAPTRDRLIHVGAPTLAAASVLQHSLSATRPGLIARATATSELCPGANDAVIVLVTSGEEFDQIERRLGDQVDVLIADPEVLEQLSPRLPAWTRPVALHEATGISLALALEQAALHRELRSLQHELAGARACAARAAGEDVLTGLANRAEFERHLHEMLEVAGRAQLNFAVMYLDLDDFKVLNDRLGMRSADQVLRRLAARIQGAMTESDMLARVGADEFAALVSSVRGVSDARRLARRIEDAVREPLVVHGARVVCEVSIGIAMYPFSATSMELLSHAHAAMVAAKHEARGGIQFFDGKLVTSTRRRRGIAELLAACVPDRVRVRYQGIYSTRSGAINALECLCYLDGEDMPGPALFIPVADEMGLMPTITRCVMEGAARDLGNYVGPRRLALNVTNRQLADRAFAARLIETCTELGFALEDVHVEVHERELIDQVHRGRVRQTLNQLHKLGARIVVDDFGTGFASIGQLIELPVTGIKLDRSLVSQMLTDRRKSSLCRGCVEMAHGLGLDVTAVGIENQDDLMLVAAMGCDFAQGDYLGPAGPLDTIAPFIDSPQRPQRRTGATHTESSGPESRNAPH